jgi:hypothetical protein
MKLSAIFSALIVLAVIIGCGGGGASTTGTSTSTSTSTSGDTIVTRMIAVNPAGKFVDPTNLQPGDTVTFKVASIDLTTDTYQPLGNGGFSTTDATNAAGSLNRSSGVFTATNPTGGTEYTVSTTSNGTTYSMLYGVTPVEPRLSGSLIDNNGLPVPFVQVIFFDAGHNQVGAATSQPDGSFNASLPTTAVRFNLKSSTVSTSAYYNSFEYGSGSYGPLIVGCDAPLPGLTNGATTPLPNTILLFATFTGGTPNTPPGPPSCSP